MNKDKDFEKAIKKLNEEYNPVAPNLMPFGVHLTSYITNKRFILELRKKWSVDLNNPEDKNKLFIKKLLSISFSGKPIIAEIKIEYKDAFKQKLKLQQQGLLQ